MTLEQSLSVSKVCCGEYATCHRPCTPRGRWEALQEPARQKPWYMQESAQNACPEPKPARQEQEPYCYVYEYDSVFGLHREFYPREWNGKKPTRTVPLYTAPQPEREWVGLTDEDVQYVIEDAMQTVTGGSNTFTLSADSVWRAITRAIEAKLREKNA